MIVFYQNEILFSMRQDNYITISLHPVCINLEPQHLAFLSLLATSHFNGNHYLAISFLLNKYLFYLYEIRITPHKKTETANYQPKNKLYKRKTILMNPVLWSNLFELRHFIGYSISALIRIMLEWEMISFGYDIIPLIPLPNLTHDVSLPNQVITTNNYLYKKQGYHSTREIICSFLNEFG
jgi:hypothetical protein